MLFNSTEFIFLFLPVVLVGFFWIAGTSHRLAALWLAVASLFFYGWWNPKFVLLLLASVGFNYGMGYAIGHARVSGTSTPRAKRLLIVALAANLALLGYFKYTNFFLATANTVVGTGCKLRDIVLPLGISFFTFTQIAFLVDTYRGIAREYNFIHYLLFVTYFPHLIAGPVLHHKEMMPQFGLPSTYRFSYENLSVGMTIFCIGLFKKVVIADSISHYVGPVFNAPGADIPLSFVEAWGGALCYTLQLYFDFSGYSDMAIGLSRLFGVALPLNFHSPYKSVNIIEFWRRWHMTLSRFLRDYLYFPLGGNRKGSARRYLNLMLTMLLGGLWHGAGWTYVVWGGLHGIYLGLNHAWQSARNRLWPNHAGTPSMPARVLSVLMTFLAVVVGWVVFRADNLLTAAALLEAMAGMNGFVLPDAWLIKWGGFGQWLLEHGVAFGSTSNLIMGDAILMISICLLIVWFAPNTQQIMASFKPALDCPEHHHAKPLLWSPTAPWAFCVFCLGFSSVVMLSDQSPFLYFQF
jgi:D-alanyl-lipoteichoic acid acyltransferase DltB (MBOAT superfamily)